MPLSRRLLLLAPPAIGLAYLARIENGIERLDAPPIPGLTGRFGALKGVRHADLKGSVTVLHAIASWCPFCQQESAFVRTLAYDRRFQLVALFIKDTEENARAYLSRHGNPYAAVGLDAGNRASQHVGVRGVPNSFILDREGRIVHTRRGMMTEDYFRQTMLPVIEASGRVL